ncbi:MAG: Hsp33 family molecular chaperone HslO [Christensenella sp.]|uniref:Hsp33 family molecular chaperone HslO n=1 Tax=Christensenella sp. TaxID=1935934 RepID=UPI002B2201F4|nr:Hsp33 family molecular chaperone HslO [Christensenella sp.]MEA5002835.1 Hsp33 family molecular chaperone HslO [Christensenella sp.]
MSDVLVRAMVNKELAVCACNISKMVEEARNIHDTLPVGTIILGRTLAAGTMMASMLKNDSDKFTLMINGGGPAGTVMAVSGANLHMKAYIANPKVNTPPNEKGGFNITDAVGKEGFVTVIKDLGLKDPYIGKTPVVNGEIGEDVACYLMTSEQQPSIVYVNTWLETDMSVVNAGGIIIRPMPGCSEETLQAVEQRVPEISNFAMYAFSDTVENVLKKIFDGMELDILDTQEPLLQCDCSKERLEQMVISLGKNEIEDMIEQDKGAEIVCRFCNKKYWFDAQELDDLLKLATKE